MTTQTDQIETLYEQAQGEWTGADGIHESIVGGESQRDASGETVSCFGGDNRCDTCTSAREDAAQAELAAVQAMDAHRAGQAGEAAHFARWAADFECRYGDALNWGPLAAALAEREERGSQTVGVIVGTADGGWLLETHTTTLGADLSDLDREHGCGVDAGHGPQWVVIIDDEVDLRSEYIVDDDGIATLAEG